MTNIELQNEKHEEFTNLCKPLIKYLNDNYHSYTHTHIIIDPTRAELSEWLMSVVTEEFILD